MKRETQNVLLLLLGGALLKITLNGTYLRYVKPSLFWFLIATGAVMILLAVWSVVTDLRQRSAEGAEDHDHADDHGHDHQHGTRSPWMLLLPVLAIFLIAPPALGADSVNRAGASSVADQAPPDAGSQFTDIPPGDKPRLKIGDFVTRAVWDKTGALNGKQVTLVGFIARNQAGQAYVARLMIACCAADARPVKVAVQGEGVEQYGNDAWVQVVGTLVPNSATEANNYTPTLKVDEIVATETPRDPYEF
ncbi:TIGR03943 family protein [Pseudonocardiaceae bacterium YIM PH 21723]|nr:TIGR03943 family protein [Pseudonocardiaceae bacterium YIM PH 21723]